MMIMMMMIMMMIIIINFIYTASISITVLGALQYHEKCIKTTLAKKYKNFDTDLVVNQERAW